MIEELKEKLLSDLSQINLPVDEVDISLRPYSKTYYGRYYPVINEKRARPKIYIYPYENRKGDLLSYEQILKTAIHEFCHHIQYFSGTYVRKRGVMHDPQFWKLYLHYTCRAEKYKLFGGEMHNESANQKQI